MTRAMRMGVLIASLVWPAGMAWSQSPDDQKPSQSENQTNKKEYSVRNGSVTYTRSEEVEKKKTADGEIETQRVRMPSWAGDRGLLFEREVRTKKLPDGTVEKEYVLKNPDGGGHLVSTEIVRERIQKNGDSTTIEREVLKPDTAGHWQPLRRETVRETGSDTARRSEKEVLEPAVSGGWKTVNRETTLEKSSQGVKETHSVRQIPDAYGRLSDYEVRDERALRQNGSEAREITLRRRDFQDTENRKSFLVERTLTMQKDLGDGKTSLETTTESDLLAGGAARNSSSSHSEVVQHKTEITASDKAGNEHTVLTVEERGLSDSRTRPAYKIVQETDRDGHVRQLFIPVR